MRRLLGRWFGYALCKVRLAEDVEVTRWVRYDEQGRPYARIAWFLKIYIAPPAAVVNFPKLKAVVVPFRKRA